MIRVENLSYKVGNKTILDSISMKLEKGKISGIIGCNGAGKSTLLKLISGLIIPSRGNIFIDSKKNTDYSAKQLARKRSVLSQEIPVNFGLSVLDILLMGRYCYGPLRALDFSMVDQIVEDLNLSSLLKTPYPSLSGGERQRVQLGRSLLQLMPFEEAREKIFILDEPLSAFDLSIQQKTLSYMKSLVQNYGITVIMVLHDLNWISKICQRVYLLHCGKLSSEGTPKEVFSEEVLKNYFSVDCKILSDGNENPVMIFN